MSLMKRYSGKGISNIFWTFLMPSHILAPVLSGLKPQIAI